MKRFAPFLLVMLLLASCTGNEPKQIPETIPDMRGSITSLKKTAAKKQNSVAIVLVEQVEGLNSNFQQASVKIDSNTLVEDFEGKVLRLEHLREGQMIEAWFDGPVMESMPVQATATAIRVINK